MFWSQQFIIFSEFARLQPVQIFLLLLVDFKILDLIDYLERNDLQKL